VVGDGRQTRDWVEVGDVVRANLLAAEADTITGALNIGHGQETSVMCRRDPGHSQ
jgi:UDP-glucose 4-epimerase